MYCKKCGRVIDDDSIYCSCCGTKQSSAIETDPLAIPDPKTVNVNLTFGRPSSQRQKVEKASIEKYDLTYQRESEATITGIIAILCFFGFAVADNVIDTDAAPVVSIFLLAARIGAVVWCINIAKRQNRDSGGWGIFAFLLPSIALIILGCMKKLKKPSSDNSDKEDNEENYTYECVHCGHIQSDDFEFCPNCKKNDDGQLANG